MKTAKLRPKKDKNTPFSSVLISSPGRGRGKGRSRGRGRDRGRGHRAEVRSTLAGLSNY